MLHTDCVSVSAEMLPGPAASADVDRLFHHQAVKTKEGKAVGRRGIKVS